MTPQEATKRLLDIAAKRGTVNDVPALLDAGADVNAKDLWQRTPLHWAVAYGRDDLARLLIAGGADVNVREEWNQTPLHFAAEHGRADIVRLLIENGADIDAKTKGQITPLDMAAEYRHAVIVEMLTKIAERRLVPARMPREPR